MQPVINPLSSLVSLGATAGAVAEAAEVLTRLAVSHGEAETSGRRFCLARPLVTKSSLDIP